MTMIPFFKKAASAGLLLSALLVAGATEGGCAYGGVATTSDGTILVARNSLLGSLRKIYVCKLTGEELKCVESAGAP